MKPDSANTLNAPDFTNSLVSVPHTVLEHFGAAHEKPALKTPLLDAVAGRSKAVLFLLDGFGYNLFQKQAAQFPFFKQIAGGGYAEKITTVFPSTTAAGITTVEAGLTPREHGLMKWNSYFPRLDAIMQPLPYQIVYPTPAATALPQDSSLLFTGKTVYQSLAEQGVASSYFVPKQLANTPYTDAMSAGATVVPYAGQSHMPLHP